ncbi:hypothetical protein ACFTAO_21040 [Paenibacillus rhizoplanae]
MYVSQSISLAPNGVATNNYYANFSFDFVITFTGVSSANFAASSWGKKQYRGACYSTSFSSFRNDRKWNRHIWSHGSDRCYRIDRGYRRDWGYGGLQELPG